MFDNASNASLTCCAVASNGMRDVTTWSSGSNVVLPPWLKPSMNQPSSMSWPMSDRVAMVCTSCRYEDVPGGREEGREREREGEREGGRERKRNVE
jgi:hypothetical protein